MGSNDNRKVQGYVLCTFFAVTCLFVELYITIILLPQLTLTILSSQVALCIGFSLFGLSKNISGNIILGNRYMIADLLKYLSIAIMAFTVLLLVFFLVYLKEGAF
ncbi:MAG: hypothetical protein AB2810_18715 [Candidatus Thiodiazotropha endolucinida]